MGLWSPKPRHDAGGKSKTGQPQAPLLRTATRPCPRTLARGLTAATTTPSRRAGPRHRRNLRLRRTAVVGVRRLARPLLSVRELVPRLPAPPADPNDGSRSRDRHGIIGERANRSAAAVPAIETTPAASAGFPHSSTGEAVNRAWRAPAARSTRASCGDGRRRPQSTRKRHY
jgi:hypothetical protein